MVNASEQAGGGRPGRAWLGWLLVVLVFYAPFWNKALHVDDGAYVFLSSLYGWNPLDARATDYVYLGVAQEGLLPYESSHPFGVPYLIKVVRTLLGGSELALHAAFTLFAVAALAGLAALDRALFGRDGARSALLVLFAVSIPTFLVPSHSVMTDVPTLALVLWAVTFYLRGLRTGSGGAWTAAAACQLGALVCSYQAVLPLGAVALHGLARGRRDARFLAAVGLPALLFGGWLGAVYLVHGVFPFVSARPESGFSLAQEVRRAVGAEGDPVWVFGSKAIHALAVLGLSVGVLLGLRARTVSGGRAFLGALAACAAVLLGLLHLFLSVYGPRADYGWGQLLLLAAFVALGVLGLRRAALASRAQDAPTRWLLGSWLVAVLLFNVALLPFSAARYHLLALPPLLLLVWRAIPPAALAARPRAVGAALAIALVLGLGSAAADARQADAYRALASELRADFPEAGLWFYGEWGLRHYLQEAGASYLLRDRDDARVGDLVVVAEMHSKFSWPPEGLAARVEKLRTVEYGGLFGLRLFDRRSRAGFWSHGWGLLPLTLSDEPFETVEVYRVVREPAS